MALFGSPAAYVGIDIGSSSLKVVELVARRRRVEVASYAEANLPNRLMSITDPTQEEDIIRQTAQAISRMIDQAQITSDAAVVAIPSGIVFSTVLMLPDIPEKDLDKAVHFAARDVVPADLDDMVLGWSRVGQTPHMDGQAQSKSQTSTSEPSSTTNRLDKKETLIPVFITAAPKDVVARHSRVLELAKLDLVAVEVETFPLIRSILGGDKPTALIIDIGDQVTNYHLIDEGTPRVSHSVEVGGLLITQAMAERLSISVDQAHTLKLQHGLSDTASPEAREAITQALAPLLSQAERLTSAHAQQSGRRITKTVLIGGGAKLKGLAEFWSTGTSHQVFVGNPWRGLAYPQELEQRITVIGPTYGVAVGLALRNFTRV